MKSSENHFFNFWKDARKIGRAKFVIALGFMLSVIILFPTLYLNAEDFALKSTYQQIGYYSLCCFRSSFSSFYFLANK